MASPPDTQACVVLGYTIGVLWPPQRPSKGAVSDATAIGKLTPNLEPHPDPNPSPSPDPNPSPSPHSGTTPHSDPSNLTSQLDLSPTTSHVVDPSPNVGSEPSRALAPSPSPTPTTPPPAFARPQPPLLLHQPLPIPPEVVRDCVTVSHTEQVLLLTLYPKVPFSPK